MQYDIVRAWKDEESQVAHPAGAVELSESELALVSGRGGFEEGGYGKGGYGKGGFNKQDTKLSNEWIFNASFRRRASNTLLNLIITEPLFRDVCNNEGNVTV